MLVVAAAASLTVAAPSTQPLASVNIVQALWSVWGADGATIADTRAAATAACRDRGFTAVRVAASPFWPSEWALYDSNKTAFFAAAREGLDALAAEGCTRIVATLFWNIFALPDRFNEPLSALPLGARGGASRSFDASLVYIDEFVAMAADAPIAAWELTNEMNLLFDLDQSQFCNCCSPPHGTPASRSRADNVSTDDGVALFAAWAARLRSADVRGLPISTGHGMARPDAEHLRASYHSPGRDWRADSFAEFTRNLQDVTACCEWASAHVYPGSDNARWNATGPDDARVGWWLQAAAAALHPPKRLFIGEYGQLPPPGGDPAAPRPFVEGLLAALAAPQPPGVVGVTELALLWVWEFASQNGTRGSNDGWAVWPRVSQGVVDSLQRYNAGGGGGM